MSLSSVSTPNAPAAIGPYSQGVRAGDLLFAAGQIALDPATGKFLEGDITQQTDRVMQNLAAVLRGANLSLADVIKTTVFLVDMADYAAMNEIYGQAFGQNPPARTTVGATALPKSARVEIDCVAVGRDL